MRLQLHNGDAPLPGRPAPPARVWGALTFSGMLVLILVASLGESGIRSTLTAPRLTELQIALLWIAALVRAGVYPLHFWLLGGKRVSQGNWLPVQLIGATAGVWLLGRVHALAGPAFLRQPQWIALSALGPPRNRARRVDRAGRRRAVALDCAESSEPGRDGRLHRGCAGAGSARVVARDVRPGCALLAAGQAARGLLGWRWPAILAALALWGMPGTVGFLAAERARLPHGIGRGDAAVCRRPAGGSARDRRAVAGGAVRTAGPDRGRQGNPARSELVLALAVILLAVPLIGFGLFPRTLAALAGGAPGSVEALRAILVADAAVGLVRPGAARLPVAWRSASTASGSWARCAAGRPASPASQASNGYTARLLAGFRLAGSGLQYFATLGEGEGYLGWLALAAFILWVLLRG